MIYPKNLEKGYQVGVTATSAGFDSEPDINRLENGIKHFNQLGYPVIETTNVRTNKCGRSSEGRTRALEFMELYENTKIRAIIAASGGDYLMEMLPHLDLVALKSEPKWVQGFSDTTGLTFIITTNLEIATLYANNFSSFGMEYWHPSLEDNLAILEGKSFVQSNFERYQDGYRKRITGLEVYDLDAIVEWKNLWGGHIDQSKPMQLEGRALGGCLDVLLNLVGTRFDKTNEFIETYKEDGIVWFLESYDLGSEALARGLWQLKEAGWFRYAKGFIFGRPAMYQSDYLIPYHEAVYSVLDELQLPIILDGDIGHKGPQVTMINGAITRITCENGKGTITFERR